MADEADPEDFTGDLEKGETDTSSSGGFGSRLKGLYTGPRDAFYNVTGVRDADTGEVNENRRDVLRVFGGVTALVAAGAGADKYSDGELDGDFNGGGGAVAGTNETGTPTATETDQYTDTPEGSGSGGTDTPAETETSSPTETETGTDTPNETGTSQQDYSGQIDGTNYELQAIPGPVQGQGYQVSDEVLESYDPDGWEDIVDEEEYQELGTAANWYVNQDAVIGVNEPEQISRTFPGEEFNYDTQALYEDIREEAG